MTLGTAASTIGILPFNRGGFGETVASATIANGSVPVYWNSVWQVVSPTNSTGLSWNLTSGTYSVGLTSNAKISGDVVQMVYASVTAATTTNGTVPTTNVPITTGNGSSFGLSLDFKATSVANKVYCLASILGTNDAGVRNGVGIFIGGSTSAVTAFPVVAGAAGTIGCGNYLWRATTVSASTITWTIRAGGTAGTFTLNGEGAAGIWANELTSSLMVWEVQN